MPAPADPALARLFRGREDKSLLVIFFRNELLSF
jgi:hypothetical protein